LKEDAGGRTVRLNKRTGEVIVIAGDKLTRLRDPSLVEAEERRQKGEDSALATPHRWPRDSQPVLGVDSMMLTTAYRDGALHYRLLIHPIPAGYATSKSEMPFELQFMDEGGLLLGSTDLARSNLTRLVDRTGPRGLEANGSVIMAADSYRLFKQWALPWRFEAPRLPPAIPLRKCVNDERLYVGSVTNTSYPVALSAELEIRLRAGGKGELRVGTPLGGSGPLTARLENGSLYLKSTSSIGDTISWFSKGAGKIISGTFSAVGGDNAGQKGTWIAELVCGVPR
jgi:hypothetical protein